jgi:integrase
MARRQSGSVDRLPSGSWRGRFRGPDGHRHTAVFTSKGDANAWLASQQTDARRGGWIDPRLGQVTVADWADTWLEGAAHLRPSTRAGYEGKLKKHIIPRLGKVPVAAIDRPAVRRFIADLDRNGMSPGNIRGVRVVLRLVLGAAVEAGAIPGNPCVGLRIPRAAPNEMHFLTPVQIEALAAAITKPTVKPAGNGAGPNWRTDRPEYGLLVRFAAYTGLRAGEIAGLTVRRIDFARGSVEVCETLTEVNGHLQHGPTKNYQRRAVPLPELIRDDLAEYLKTKRHRPEDPVFTAPEGGPFRHKGFYRRQFKPAILQAGLPNGVRFHDLRHTYASLMIAQGAHPRAIMERMGHSSIQVTLGTYGHVLPGIDERLTSGLDIAARAARAAFATASDPDKMTMS